MHIIDVKPVNAPDVPAPVCALEYRSAEDSATDWAWIWPPARGHTWAVVIHGHGSHGDQIYRRADIRQRLDDFRSAGWGILSPNLRDNAWMGPSAAADLHILLDLIRNQFAAQTFLFFSGSMGGTSNLIYAALHPEDVAGVVALGAATDLALYQGWCRTQTAVPILKEIADAIQTSYGSAPEDNPGIYRRHSALRHARRLTMPIFLSHGTADAIIPIAEAHRLAEALVNSPNFLYKEIPNGNHDSPIAAAHAAFLWLRDRITSEKVQD